MTTASDPAAGGFIFLMLALVVGCILYLVIRDLYQRYQLWDYVAEDEDQDNPLQTLYEYKAKEVENQQ